MAGLLNLGSLGEMLDTQNTRRETRQAADAAATTKRINMTQDASRRAAGVSDQARASADASRKAQIDILSGVDGQVDKAKVAIELSNSKNPMDRLKLYMLQQTDKSYTRAGNLERIQYFQSAAAGLSDRAVLEQAGFADSLAGIEQELNLSLMEDEGDLELLKLQETQGAELIDAMVANQNIKLGQMQTNQAMQEVALSDLTQDQLQVAAEQAKEKGTANISGIEVSAPDIDVRLNAMKDRAYLMDSREIERADLLLSDATMDDLTRMEAEAKNSKDGRVDVSGVNVSLGRIQDRKAVIQQRDYSQLTMAEGSRQIVQNRRQETEQRIVNTFSVPELNKLIMAGGVDDKGYQYEMPLLTSARDVKSATQANMLQQQMAISSVGEPGKLAVSHSTFLDSIKAAPGSQLSQMIETQRAATNIAANFVMSDDPMERLMGIQAIQGSRAAMDEGIAMEAKRLAAGDKDLELALGYQLRGQVVPAQIVQDAILERAAKNQPIGQWLSAQNRGTFTTVYQSELTRLKMSEQGAMLDIKTQQQMAADTAMQQVMASASAGITEELLQQQFDARDNPLKGVMSPATFMNLVRRADEEGARQYQQATGMSQEELQKRISGTTDDPNLATAQTAQLQMELEKIKPGLGQRYTEWWSTPYPREMVSNYVSAKASTFNDMSQLSEFSLVAPMLQDSMTKYGILVEEGRNVMFSNQLAKEHANYVTFGGSPESKQVFLLEQTPDMSSAEKQQAFAIIIKPLLAEVSNQKMNQAAASSFIEQQLRTMRPTDPVARKLQLKIMGGRDSAIKVVDDFINIQTQRRATATGFAGGRLNDVGVADQFNKQASGFDWYRELQGN